MLSQTQTYKFSVVWCRFGIVLLGAVWRGVYVSLFSDGVSLAFGI